jgi:hypothetical protein
MAFGALWFSFSTCVAAFGRKPHPSFSEHSGALPSRRYDHLNYANPLGLKRALSLRPGLVSPELVGALSGLKLGGETLGLGNLIGCDCLM